MAEIVFSGNYQSPVVIEIPGLISPGSINPWRVLWGEDIVFRFPAVSGDGISLKLLIKDRAESDEVLIEQVPEEGEDDALSAEVSGADARAKLSPGIFYFCLLKTQDSSSSEIASGEFLVYSGVSSLEIEPST